MLEMKGARVEWRMKPRPTKRIETLVRRRWKRRGKHCVDFRRRMIATVEAFFACMADFSTSKRATVLLEIFNGDSAYLVL